jgi:hypothetical protein
MPALPNPRHEHFAVLIAGGTPPTQAYLAAGFSGRGTAQSASRLARVAAVAKRIADLQERALLDRDKVLKSGTINLVALRERVLKNLVSLAELSRAEKKYATSVRCEQLLGQAAGLFTEARAPEWDGDINKLTAAQRQKFQHTMEQEIYGDDTARLAADKAAWLKEWEERKRKTQEEAAHIKPVEPTVQ